MAQTGFNDRHLNTRGLEFFLCISLLVFVWFCWHHLQAYKYTFNLSEVIFLSLSFFIFFFFSSPPPPPLLSSLPPCSSPSSSSSWLSFRKVTEGDMKSGSLKHSLHWMIQLQLRQDSVRRWQDQEWAVFHCTKKASQRDRSMKTVHCPNPAM